MKYEYLSQHPNIFQKCTGITVSEFDELVNEVLPLYAESEVERLQRDKRQRAMGAGHPFELAGRDHVLLTIVWLRLYPIHEVLGYLFAISDSTVSRVIERVLPILAQAGRDTMRLPDPGKKRRRHLSDLLGEIPELTRVVDSFEQRVQRLPQGCGLVGDLGYLGMDKLYPLAFIPRRKPRGKPHPPQHQLYNTAFAALSRYR